MLDLGEQPPADLFPAAEDPGPDESFPLRLWLCESCGLAQLWGEGPEPAEPRAIEPQALVAQAREAVEWVVKDQQVRAGQSLLEYGSPHGGSWTALLEERGLAQTKGDTADVIVDCFGLMHAPDQRAAIEERTTRLADQGQLFIQYHSLGAILLLNQWNALRHGHFAYYTGSVLQTMLADQGLTVRDATRFLLYGGTVLLGAARGKNGRTPQLFAGEDSIARKTPESFSSLQAAADQTATALRAWLAQMRVDGKAVAGYGAASRAVSVVSRAGLDPGLLGFVADASPTKIGRRFPNSTIPIFAPQAIAEQRPEVVLVFVPDMIDEVRAMFPEHERSGRRFAVLDPLPHVLEPRVRL